ncbi:MAG: GDSL-type esterase/lipase family protein [Planctomycetota bacterium]
MKRSTKILLLATAATAFALAVGEIAARCLPKPQPLGRLSYQTAGGEPVADIVEAARRGFVVPLPPDQTPRPRYQFAPGLDFFLCYTDNDRLHRDWLDERGRVPVHINRFGVRERDEITPDKPAGEKRIVCIGDSFTFGWGVRAEDCWVRLLEDALRKDGKNVRTVNCGASGTVVVDEYVAGLQHRFARFGPDAVILTICLNDLIPCSGLFVQGPAVDTGSRLLDLLVGAMRGGPLELDPAVDWVDLLLKLPAADGMQAGLYGENNPFDALWEQGGPQRALASMKAWCDERKIAPMIVLWPFLQGLGEHRHYPFAKLHTMVADECRRLGLPFLDVLPALRGTRSEDLWVTPADMHPNPNAMRLALPLVREFVNAHADL